jgi:ketosteroid isomerase-like protein
LHQALEAGQSGEALRPLFTDDAQIVEHPNAIKPRGATATLAQILANSEQGSKLLARQTYDVKDAFELGTLAVCRLTWTGVIARDLGPFREGQVLTAQIAQFIETRDDRIRSVETFDCYEPWA